MSKKTKRNQIISGINKPNTLEPKLIWTVFPSINQEYVIDLHTFDLQYLGINNNFSKEKEENNVILASNEFLEELKNSKKITIVDKYISPNQLEIILRNLKVLSNNYGFKKPEIEIFTEQKSESIGLEETKDNFKNSNFTVSIYYLNEKNKIHIHDRFAILDDEIWHFGAAVGNMYRDGLTVCSRGWSEEQWKLRDLMERIKLK